MINYQLKPGRPSLETQGTCPAQSKAAMDIVLDFDGTITAEDSIGCLGAFAVSHQQKRCQHAVDLSSTWEQIVTGYVDDYKAHVAGYSPAEAERLTHEEERAFLRSLHQVDVKSLVRVAHSKLFEGCTEDDLFGAGQEAVRTGAVTPRHGFAEFVAAMSRSGASLSILSVNWSASFIRGVLSRCCGVVIGDIVSNEIAEEGTIGGRGGRDKSGTALMTSLHKLEALEDRAAAAQTRNQGTSSSSPRTTFYFGDSTTDLECLLAADFGIVMADDETSSLLRALSRLGFHVPPVSNPIENKRELQPVAGPQKLAWATSFTEVLESGFLRQAEIQQPPIS